MSDRFQLLTYAEVRARQKNAPPFLVPGLVSAHLTGLIGEPYAGKSSVATNLVASALTGGEFLGRPWARRPDRAVVVCTDPGLVDEYTNRLADLAEAAGREDYGTVVFLERAPRTVDDWEEFATDARIGSGTLVVVDNLSGVVDTNNAQEVRPFLEAVTDVCVTARRAPVVIAAHSSSKTGFNGRKPKGALGLTSISGAFRLELRISRNPDGSIVTVDTQGNQLPEPERLVLHRGPAGAADLQLESSVGLRQLTEKRSAATYDKRADMAAFVVAECQGQNKAATAVALARRFGGTAGSHGKWLQPSGPLGQMLTHDGGRWAPVEG